MAKLRDDHRYNLKKNMLLICILLCCMMMLIASRKTILKNPTYLHHIIDKAYASELAIYSNAKIIAIATFPANDFKPGFGNGVVLFKKNNSGNYLRYTNAIYPLQVAGRHYRGPHTWHKPTYLKSPVGIFEVYRGTRNGSRYMSWVPSVAKYMMNADNVPAFGVKIPIEKKPQKHFSYAFHTTPITYTREILKKKQFESLGCWGVHVEDMRSIFSVYTKYRTKDRLLISIYDTISIDIEKRIVHIYKDIYNENSNTLKNFYNELQKRNIPTNYFNKKKVLAILNNIKDFHQEYTFESLI